MLSARYALRGRTLPYIPPGIAALRTERRRQLAERPYAGEFWNEQRLVFANATGGPLNPSAVTKGLQKRLAELGLPRMRFHDLRRSCATVHLALGTPAKTVQALLGHSSISLTPDTYSHVIPEVLTKAVARLAGLKARASLKQNGRQMGVKTDEASH